VRSRVLVAILALTLAGTMAPPASASHSVSAGAYYSESYQATIPLRRGARATIYFARYVGAGATAYVTTPPSPYVAAAPETYYACVSVYKRRDPRYYPSLSTCGEPEVARFSLDPQMDRMRLQFDIVDDWYWYYADSDLPTSVNLRIRGRHPVRSGTPDASASTYGVYASKWDTRQATASGRVAGPGVGSRRVKPHSPRRGMIARGLSTSQYPPYTMWP
jgi:hypothetical protein